MKNKLVCMTIIALTTSTISMAGTRPGAMSIRLADGYIFFAQKRHIQNTATPTIELGYEFNDQWGVKTGASVLNTNTNHTGPDFSVHGFIYTLDGVFKFAKHGKVEPYALGGVGVTSIKVHNYPNYNADPTNQANVNAGLGAHYFIDPSISLNAEAKDLYTLSGGKNDVMLTAGVTFYFGGEAMVKPVSYKGA